MLLTYTRFTHSSSLTHMHGHAHTDHEKVNMNCRYMVVKAHGGCRRRTTTACRSDANRRRVGHKQSRIECDTMCARGRVTSFTSRVSAA